MAVVKKKAAKKKSYGVDLTLWDVILSYPDLHEPKPYKGKIYYRTDVLFDKDDPQVKSIKKAERDIKSKLWGEDKSEWPDNKAFVRDGDEREDQKAYKGKYYITASTQQPVPVIKGSGGPFNPQMVKGGMFANVAIRLSSWEFDGDEGASIYLQGVQIDTSKPGLNFGGGKTVEQMFKKSKASDHDEDADSDESDEQDEVEDSDEESEDFDS